MNNQNAVYIGTYGYVVKIDQTTGKELWRTSLPNVGYNPTTTYLEDNAVYCGCNGKVFILCCETGKIMAQNEMYGLGFGFVTFTSKKSDKRNNNQPHNQKPNNPKPQINQNNNNQVNIQQMNQQPLFHLPPQQPQMMQSFLIQPFPQQSNFQQASPQFLLQPPQLPLISSQMMLEQNMLNDPFRIPPQQPFPIFHQQSQNNHFQQPQPNFFLNPLNQLNHPNQAHPRNNSFDSNEMIVVDNSNNNAPLLSQQDILNQFSLTESIKQKQIEEDEKLALSLHQQMNGQQQGRVQQPPKQQPPKQQPHLQNSYKNVINLEDLIFVGLNTSIVAINKFSGEDVWRSYIGQYSAPISMTYSDDKLLIGVSGTLQCLNALTGEKCWENNLPGLRYHCVSVVTSN